MAKFEFDGIDDVLEELNSFIVNCPACNKTFEVSADAIGSKVKCPHCKSKIKLER